MPFDMRNLGASYPRKTPPIPPNLKLLPFRFPSILKLDELAGPRVRPAFERHGFHWRFWGKVKEVKKKVHGIVNKRRLSHKPLTRPGGGAGGGSFVA